MPESADAFYECRPPNALQIVEGSYAVHCEALVLAKADLSRDLAHGSRHGSDHDSREYLDSLGTRDHQNGTTLVLGLGPPDLSSGRKRYHGSSSIRERVASSNPASSSSFWGCRR